MNLESELSSVTCKSIIAERKKRGMSQREIAELLGVSQRTISNWERNVHSKFRSHSHLSKNLLAFVSGEHVAKTTEEDQGDLMPLIRALANAKLEQCSAADLSYLLELNRRLKISGWYQLIQKLLANHSRPSD